MREHSKLRLHPGEFLIVIYGKQARLALLVLACILYLFVTFCAGIMSEAPKRNSTRERKPNRFLQLDDLDPPNHSASRLPEPRDSRSTSENLQLARLLLRFVQSANKKLREHPDPDPEVDPQAQPQASNDPHRHPPSATKVAEKRPTGAEIGQTQARRGQDGRRNGQEEAQKSSKQNEKKPQQPTRQPQPSTTDPDLPDHRTKQPSSETQGPQSHQGKSPQKQQSRQRKKKGSTGGERTQQEQLKPFKRQSYHVAIAYHIHIQKIRAEGKDNNPRIDPTYQARRLREMQEKQA